MAEDTIKRAFDDNDRNFFEEFSRRMQRLADDQDLRGTVRVLKQTPASDREKKRLLSAFFQDDAGGRFSREEKHAAYNDLLGEQRNRRQT